MTTLLDAPTRKEKVMLERKLAAVSAEPETTPATELPVVEVSTGVVIDSRDSADLEQSPELVADTTVEPVTELPEPDDADDDVFPVSKPRTGGLPMVAFKPLGKDMTDDDDTVPYVAPVSTNPFFADDDEDDEWGVQSQPTVRKPRTEEEQAAWEAEFDAKAAAAAVIKAAEDKARKEKEAKEKREAEAKRDASIEKRGSRRALGIFLLAFGAAAVSYGALVVPFWPGM